MEKEIAISVKQYRAFIEMETRVGILKRMVHRSYGPSQRTIAEIMGFELPAEGRNDECT